MIALFFFFFFLIEHRPVSLACLPFFHSGLNFHCSYTPTTCSIFVKWDYILFSDKSLTPVFYVSFPDKSFHGTLLTGFHTSSDVHTSCHCHWEIFLAIFLSEYDLSSQKSSLQVKFCYIFSRTPH